MVRSKKYRELLERLAKAEERIAKLEGTDKPKDKKEVRTPADVMDEWLNGKRK